MNRNLAFNRKFVFAFIILLIALSCKNIEYISATRKSPTYDQINARIEKMSLEEKVGQTCQVTLDVILKTDEKGVALNPAVVDTNKLNEVLFKYHVGSVLNVGYHTLSLAEWKGILEAIHKPY